MGRKSTNPHKSIYQITRERLNLTREKASELMPGISPERIEKIENGKVNILPGDILEMSKCYKDPSLCNYYCTHECEIGKVNVQEIKQKELVQIAVETLTSLNKMSRMKDRLLEIAEDGEITPDEYDDFRDIKETLDKMALSVNTLQLWIDKKEAEGEIDDDIFD